MVPNVMRFFGHMVSLYLDDRLFIQPTDGINPLEAQPTVCFMGTLLIIASGGYISIKKSEFRPKTKTEFLGLNIDTVTCEVSVPLHKWQKLSALISEVVSQDNIGFRMLEKIRGILCSFIMCYEKLKLYIRRQTEALLLSDLRQGHIPQERRRIPMSERLRTELLEWQKVDVKDMKKCWIYECRTFLQITSIWSDASQTAAGAVIFRNGRRVAEMTRYFAEAYHADCIAIKEALAILFTLQEYPRLFKGKCIVSFCDNQNVYFAFKNEGSRVPKLNDIVRMIYEELVVLDATINVYWVGTEIQLGDRPSRRVDLNEEFLPQAHFRAICNHIGTFPQVDSMSTADNKKCKWFIPWRPSRSKWAINNDFLAMKPENVQNKILYIFPPKNMLARVLSHVQSNFMNSRFIMIVHVFKEWPLGVQMFQNNKKSKIFYLDTNRHWTLFPSESEMNLEGKVVRGRPNTRVAKFLVITHNLRCHHKPECITYTEPRETKSTYNIGKRSGLHGPSWSWKKRRL